jgi:hypothetical protein
MIDKWEIISPDDALGLKILALIVGFLFACGTAVIMAIITMLEFAHRLFPKDKENGT